MVWAGIALLFFCAGVWLVTNRIEPLLVTAGGSLIVTGLGGQTLAALRPPSSPPQPAEKEEES